MKLFLDTANVAHVAEIASWGVLDGVTTNPSLVLKEGKDFKETVLTMCQLVDEVSAQVTATDFEGMKAQALEYAAWHSNVVVKVPMTTEGIKTVKFLTTQNIKTNVTLVFSVPQAILAAKAGATMISPFVGRIDDTGEDGMLLISDILAAWQHYAFATQVLVASVRKPEHVTRAAIMGAHICTIPYTVFQKLCIHPLTDAGLEKFLADWEHVKQL